MIVDYSLGVRNGRFFTFYDNGKPARYDFYVDDRLTQKQCFTYEGKKTAYFPYMEDATFPGGVNNFKKYIYDSIKFPLSAREKNMRGHVMVEFEILEDGNVGEVEIIESDNPIFNDEAIRIIKNSPPWNPGRIDGKNAGMRYRIPILFQI